MVFWVYRKSRPNPEYWVSRNTFEALKATQRRLCSQWEAANPDKVKAKIDRRDPVKEALRKNAWRRANPEYIKAWREVNRDRVRFACRVWRRKNPNYEKSRYSSDALYALTKRLRSRLRKAARASEAKGRSVTVLLGCPLDYFHTYLQAQFLPGMTWDNRHLWHIDHIVPCKAGKTKEQIEALFHYTNLRPMWGRENQSKSSKLPEEHELPDNLYPKVKEIYLTARMRSLGRKV